MHRNASFVGLFVVSFFFVLPVCPSDAQPPDRLTRYRFLPRHSTLHVQGGFGGFDIQANIFGKFSFVEGFRYDFPFLDPYAAFVDVRAEAINPTDFGPYSFDLDQTLNLSGLDGEQLPVGAPFDVYRFTGEDGQGAPMELTAVKLGRWLYMKGANDAPCCDFFDYEIETIARQVPFADFTVDDRVDGSDLVAWSAGFGNGDTADSDDDGDSDGTDFLTWQRQHGEVMPDMETFAAMAAFASEQAAIASVPEPKVWALAVAALVIVAMLRRHSPGIS